MDFAYIFFFLTIIVAILYLLISKITNKALNNKGIVEIFLMSFLVISVGIGYGLSLVMHFCQLKLQLA